MSGWGGGFGSILSGGRLPCQVKMSGLIFVQTSLIILVPSSSNPNLLRGFPPPFSRSVATDSCLDRERWDAARCATARYNYRNHLSTN